MMIYLKWLVFFILDIALLLLAYPLAPVLSLFTEKGWPSWGSWFWTYDNPPQGDLGYQAKRAPYTPAATPWQLYVNRVCWLWRNPCYGLQKALGIQYGSDLTVLVLARGGAGTETSDKYKRGGWYYAECLDDFGTVVAFELYAVLPWSDTRCIRLRWGWKIVTDKFQRNGFAPLVDTMNPFDGYGDD